MNCSVCSGIRVIDGWLSSCALIMQRMTCLSWAWYVHGVRLHMQLSGQWGIVMPCGLMLYCLAFAIMQNLVFLFDSSMWTIWWTTLLRLAIPITYWLVHGDSRCGCVLVSFHNLQFGFGWVIGQGLAKLCFNLGVTLVNLLGISKFYCLCNLCVEIPSAFQNWFEGLWWTSWLKMLFSTYVNLVLAIASSSFFICLLCMCGGFGLLQCVYWLGFGLANKQCTIVR